MEDRWILLGLHELEGIGWKTIRSIMDRFDRLSDLLELDAGDFERLGIRRSRAGFLAAMNEESILRKAEQYEKRGMSFVTFLDPEYPDLLKRSSQPPWVLYTQGNIELLQRPLLSMVGTRTPTAYGKRVAADLSKQLSERGFTLVSGLARGIDACAHLGALTAPGSTIAVLGGGLDQIYPPENRGLYHQISQNGLLLSEMPYGTTLHPGLFPLRNRIIAGLSLGTIVVEAAELSGSLITASIALDESRDVFGIPGPITSPKSRGVHKLIKDGAKLTDRLEDILEQYVHLVPTSYRIGLNSQNSSQELTADEQKVLLMLSPLPVSIDLLLQQSGLDFGHLHSVLLSLLIKNKIEQLPGALYVTV
jgi:DNA processing protein